MDEQQQRATELWTTLLRQSDEDDDTQRVAADKTARSLIVLVDSGVFPGEGSAADKAMLDNMIVDAIRLGPAEPENHVAQMQQAIDSRRYYSSYIFAVVLFQLQQLHGVKW